MDFDIRATVMEALENGIRLAGAEDTPANRITILQGIHHELSEEAPINAIRNAFLLEIENEVARLQGGR